MLLKLLLTGPGIKACGLEIGYVKPRDLTFDMSGLVNGEFWRSAVHSVGSAVDSHQSVPMHQAVLSGFVPRCNDLTVSID